MTRIKLKNRYFSLVRFDHFSFSPNKHYLVFIWWLDSIKFTDKPTEEQKHKPMKKLSTFQTHIELLNYSLEGRQWCYIMGKQQQVVAMCSYQPGYQGLAAEAQVIVLLHQLFAASHHPQKYPTSLGEDNENAQKFPINHAFQKRSKSKYIEIKQKFSKK